MNFIDKVKEKVEDIKYSIPDWGLFVIKVSIISIIWIVIIS